MTEPKLPRGVLKLAAEALEDAGFPGDAWAAAKIVLASALPAIERDVRRSTARQVLALDEADRARPDRNKGPFWNMRTCLRKLARENRSRHREERGRPVTDPIPAEALSAAALAIEAQPAGSSAAHLARVALEAAVPLLRAAGEETRIEWGVRFTIGGVNERELASEEDARTVVANMRQSRPEFGAVLIVRTPGVPAGPWRVAEEGGHA